MRFNELTFEAEVMPGQVKPIKVKIAQYQQELRDLERKQDQLDNQFRFGDLNNFSGPEYEELRDKLAAYINAYTDKIEQLKAELSGKHSDKGFDNFIAGLQKNCSEVIKFYRERRKFIYAGFQNAIDQTAMYARLPTRVVMPHAYENKHFREISNLVEKFNLGSFNSAVLCNGFPYEVSQDGRHPFIIFPVNGFKYFYPMTQPRLRIDDRNIPTTMDKMIKHQAWKKLVGDPAMLEKFRAAGAENLTEIDELDIGYTGGFLGPSGFRSHLKAIGTMVDDGTLDSSWADKELWENWVTEKSFQLQFNIDDKNLGWALSNQNDVIINAPAVYAINMHHSRAIQDAIGMKDY
jgi:hypothetical protein